MTFDADGGSELVPPKAAEPVPVPCPAPPKETVVYVVDDEPLVAEVVASIVEMIGMKPVVFQNPATLLESFVSQQPPPKLLVTDFVMRPLNGIELIERCKALAPGLKTILFSGSVDESITSRCVEKPDKFLPKPLQLSVLAETIRDLLPPPAST
jgi:DNA-binding NtrC family response regulator